MNQTQNEPVTPDDAPVPIREDNHKRALIVGIGRCGVRILHCLNQTTAASWIDTLAIDTDTSDLNACSATWKINAFSDYSKSNANGCGGDIEMGTRAVAHERNNIEAKWVNHDVVIVVGGLGGGTTTGGMQTLLSIAKAKKIPTIFLMLLPFSFESYARRKNADKCIEELQSLDSIIVPIPADLLFSTCLKADTPVTDAYESATREIAAMLGGLAAMLQGHDIIGTNYATLANALRRKKSNCGLGIGYATSEMGPDRSTIALAQLLESPFLGGREHFEKCDATVITLTAGPDLTIGEMKRTFELISEHFPKNSELIFGASILNSAKDTLQLTALTIRYDQLPKTKRGGKRAKAETNKTAKQPEETEPDLFGDFDGSGDDDLPGFNFPIYQKGVFESPQGNTDGEGEFLHEIRYEDEDLDIPTYQRRNLHIDKGV